MGRSDADSSFEAPFWAGGDHPNGRFLFVACGALGDRVEFLTWKREKSPAGHGSALPHEDFSADSGSVAIAYTRRSLNGLSVFRPALKKERMSSSTRPCPTTSAFIQLIPPAAFQRLLTRSPGLGSRDRKRAPTLPIQAGVGSIGIPAEKWW